MAIKQGISTVLNKEMDRSEFLRFSIVAIVAVTGIGTLLRTFNVVGSRQSSQTVANGYGSMPYGGAKNDQ
ncbi:hypothetical protein I8H83_03010 [Candidatus Saccharibacteria bacterium]|nr:hypothetical protein [Candidatus Saccharibacteria bacterium]MBH2007546.1 hypothetical protein [Candidatus Saccharibacteria bacterium]